MTGRHLNMSSDSHLNLLNWRIVNKERVLSCLFLTIFLADDATTQADMDIK
jgi:hypothetical protein